MLSRFITAVAFTIAAFSTPSLSRTNVNNSILLDTTFMQGVLTIESLDMLVEMRHVDLADNLVITATLDEYKYLNDTLPKGLVRTVPQHIVANILIRNDTDDAIIIHPNALAGHLLVSFDYIDDDGVQWVIQRGDAWAPVAYDHFWIHNNKKTLLLDGQSRMVTVSLYNAKLWPVIADGHAVNEDVSLMRATVKNNQFMEIRVIDADSATGLRHARIRFEGESRCRVMTKREHGNSIDIP